MDLPRTCSHETGSSKSLQPFVISSIEYMQENTTTNDVTTHTYIEEITKGCKFLLQSIFDDDKFIISEKP